MTQGDLFQELQTDRVVARDTDDQSELLRLLSSDDWYVRYLVAVRIAPEHLQRLDPQDPDEDVRNAVAWRKRNPSWRPPA